MWTPDPTRLVKVRLHNRGEDVETPFAEDLGAEPSCPGARRVRLGNVPFLHAKPTYEDVIVVAPDAEGGLLAWDSEGVEWEQIGTRVAEDAGRWVMIVDYAPDDPAAETKPLFQALDRAAEAIDVCVEGAYGAKPEEPGRMYLAVPRERSADQVLEQLRGAGLAVRLHLEHPVDDEPEVSA